MTKITIVDETTTGQRVGSFTLECLAETMTVREIIRARIYQEVTDYNQTKTDVFMGLVEPSDAERTSKGYKMPQGRLIDWEDQYTKALKAFEQNGFFVLVGNRQAESLEEQFEIKVDTEISFIKLVALVGG